MNDAEFQVQIGRLKTQWPNTFGVERLKRLWETFKGLPLPVFSDMVDMAVDTMRAAPLVDDLCRFETEVKKRHAQSRVYDSYSSRGYPEQISEAARANKTADKEFVAACQKLLNQRWRGEITYAQFQEGCDALDQMAELINPTKAKTRQLLSSNNEYRAYKED